MDQFISITERTQIRWLKRMSYGGSFMSADVRKSDVRISGTVCNISHYYVLCSQVPSTVLVQGSGVLPVMPSIKVSAVRFLLDGA